MTTLEFTVKVNTGYDVRYYSSVATLVGGLRSRRFYGFDGAREKIEEKYIQLFVKPNTNIDENAFYALIKKYEEGPSYDNKKAWTDSANKDFKEFFKE